MNSNSVKTLAELATIEHYDDIHNIIHWVRRAEPGARLIYYTGSLQYNIAKDADLRKIASYMLHLSDKGKVCLVQDRVGEKGADVFNYIAVKRSKG